MSGEPVEIVASFPLPPKQFYEHLTEEEILQLEPPEIPKESIKVFGFDQVKNTVFVFKCLNCDSQKLVIEDKDNLVFSDDLVSELKAKKMEIFDNFKRLFNEFETMQDPTKVKQAFRFIFMISS